MNTDERAEGETAKNAKAAKRKIEHQGTKDTKKGEVKSQKSKGKAADPAVIARLRSRRGTPTEGRCERSVAVFRPLAVSR